MTAAWMKEVRFDDRGLVTAVIQDVADGRILMVGYMNREALRLTAETGQVHFWSRSRQALWRKGESSGHVQRAKEIRLDCDGDAVLVRVSQAVAACHTGHRSCFFRALRGLAWEEIETPVFDPEAVYGASLHR
jgi:phosphoribosyl-AMP cyclohydrolase